MIRFDTKKDLEYYDNLHGEIHKKDKEIARLNKKIEHTSNELQKLIDDINNKTIISLGSFSIRLETIYDELVGGVDKE